MDNQLGRVLGGGARRPWPRPAASGNTPICRRGGNSPDISMGVQRDPNQEQFFITAGWRKVRDPPCDAAPAGKPAHPELSVSMQSLRTAKTATLRAHDP